MRKSTAKHFEGLAALSTRTAGLRAAVKAGDTTSQKELEYLMELLRRDPTLRSCPHGRPIFVAITRRDLEKMFGRLG